MALTTAQKGAVGGLAAAITLATPLVAAWEGKRNDPYVDIAGVVTVCYGETRNVGNRHYSDAECLAMLNQSLARHAAQVIACMPPAPVPTQAAFISFGYNVGAAAACGSGAMRRLRAGDIQGACDNLLAWDKVRSPVTGKLRPSTGLANRRAAERRLCMQGLSK